MKKLLFIFLVFCSLISCGQREFLLQSETDFTTGLVALYKMDDISGDMVDEVSGNDFTVSSATRQEDGILNDCYYFNGTSDFCSNATPPLGDITGDSATLAVWVKFDTIYAADDRRYVWADAIATVDEVGIIIYKAGTSNNKIIGGASYSAGSGGVQNTTSLTEDVWYLVVNRIKKPSGSISFKINVDNNVNTGSVPAVRIDWCTGTSYVGKNYTTAWYMEGWIDNIALWDHWLTDSQINEYYKNGLRGKEI